MLVTTDITTTDPEDIVVPEHPDGGEYSYAIFTSEGTATFTDSLIEAISQNLPGYAELAERMAARESDSDDAADAMLGMRYDDLRIYADALQRWMVNDAAEQGKIDLEQIGDQALSALMNERFVPFEGIEGSGGTISYTWEHEAPLILFVTDYQPYTNRPQPSGKIIWIDPSTELTYMQSLDTLGVVDFMVLEL
ncbi:MAG: hypothetical protein ACYCX8_09360 [Acidimicrobiales bacterium]